MLLVRDQPDLWRHFRALQGPRKGSLRERRFQAPLSPSPGPGSPSPISVVRESLTARQASRGERAPGSVEAAGARCCFSPGSQRCALRRPFERQARIGNQLARREADRLAAVEDCDDDVGAR